VKKLALALALGLLGSTSMFAAFGSTGTTDVTLTVAAEAAIQVDTATTALTNAGTFTDYTGTTNLTYKIRTGKTTGTGAITLQVTSDFSPAGGPSVTTPPTAGDALGYTCTVSSPGTACSGSQTSATTSSTSVATFGANARSAKTGNSGSIDWTLSNDPSYQTGSYSSTVTFTISAS
jgi:hypothetical protein